MFRSDAPGEVRLFPAEPSAVSECNGWRLDWVQGRRPASPGQPPRRTTAGGGYVFIYLSICLFIYLFIYLFTYDDPLRQINLLVERQREEVIYFLSVYLFTYFFIEKRVTNVHTTESRAVSIAMVQNVKW